MFYHPRIKCTYLLLLQDKQALSSSVLKLGDTRTGILSLNAIIHTRSARDVWGKEASCSVATQDTRHSSYSSSYKHGLGDPLEYHCRASTELLCSSDDRTVA